MNIDRGAVMRRAHALRKAKGMSMSDAMKAAWAEAKAPPALPTVRPGIPDRAIALARAMTGARIEVAFRIRVDIGVRVTPRDVAPMAVVRSGEIGAVCERRSS